MLIPIGFFGGRRQPIYGETFTAYTLPATYNPRGGAYATGGGHVLLGQNASYLTSPDGKTWTTRSVGNAGDHVADRNIASNGTVYVMTANTQETRVSTDGINWTSRSDLTVGNVRSISWANGVFVILNTNGGNSWRSTDGYNWTSFNRAGNIPGRLSYANGYWVIGAGDALTWSTDLSTWTVVSSGPKLDDDVNSNGVDLFVAAPGYKSFYTTFTNPTSTNNMVERTSPITNEYLMADYYQTNWILRPYSYPDGNKYAYSLDGITWTLKTANGTTMEWKQAWGGNNQYIVHFASTSTYNSNQIWISE